MSKRKNPISNDTSVDPVIGQSLDADTDPKPSQDKLTGKCRQDELHAAQNVKDTIPGVSRRKFMSGATTLAVLGSTGVLELLAPTTAEAIERGPFVANPQQRVNQFVTVRNNATTEDANIEITQFPHRDNGDDELYPDRLGSFSKTLPHNDFGEVDQSAYHALLHAVDTGSPADFCAVPLAGPARVEMANPPGRLPPTTTSPDSPDTSVLPPPPFASGALAP